MKLEDRLHRALRRVDPDDGFADRVLARLEPARDAAPARRWAIAACVLIAVGVGIFAQQQRVQSRQEAAGRQLAYALDLTSRELQSVQRHLSPRIEETGT